MSVYQEWLAAEGDRWRNEQRFHRSEEMNFGIQPEDFEDTSQRKDDENDDRSV